MIDPVWVSQQFPDLTAVSALAQGAQKWVFSANHPLNGDVVLKLVKPTADVERIHREILAVTQTGSTRIPRIYEHGATRHALLGLDLLWLREQRIAGSNVRDYLAVGPMRPLDVFQLAVDVLEALADLTAARIIHRDIKPENIVRANDGRFWLLDFGIARHLDLVSLTATAMGGPGTPGYAPPEQYRNIKKDVDARADFFALAVTMAECLTGQHPYRFQARDISEVYRRVENNPLPLPQLTWDVSGRATDFIGCLGQRRADCRPANVADALGWAREIHAVVRGT